MTNEKDHESPVTDQSMGNSSVPVGADQGQGQAAISRDSHVSAGEKESAKGTAQSTSPWKMQLALLSGMLLLALVGMGLNQTSKGGIWEYWLVVVLIYGCLSAWRSSAQARKADKPVFRILIRQAGHWGVLLVFMVILASLERSESATITRQVASKASLVLLALTCCLAGVHFEWLFLIVGSVLTIMVVALETVQQPFWLWVIMIVAAVVGIGLSYWRTRSG